MEINNVQEWLWRMTQLCVRRLRKTTHLENELSGVASPLKTGLSRGSSSLKQALLVQFKLPKFTRNLRFPVILTCFAILAFKDSAALLTASGYTCIISSWVIIVCSCCQISGFPKACRRSANSYNSRKPSEYCAQSTQQEWASVALWMQKCD
jgi:hypothetical protein